MKFIQCLCVNSPQEPGQGQLTGRGQRNLLSSSASWSPSSSKRPSVTKLRNHLSGDIPRFTPLPGQRPFIDFPLRPGHSFPLP